MLNVPAAHRAGYTGAGVTVLILDSGFYKSHEVFANTQIVGEWDFVQGNFSSLKS
jgi:subtilisin family serine protease